jgi:hypothetical protein
MAIVLLNGDVTGVTYAANTWGELLDLLDAEQSAVGDVVTAMRLDGVDVAAFRTPPVLAWRLDASAEVCIDTARPLDLIREALDEADAATPAIVEAAVALAVSFRTANLSAANRSLPEFAENLGALVAVTATVAQRVNVDLSAIGDGQASVTQMIDRLVTQTDALLGAQLAGDWQQVANVIDNHIVTALRRWPLVLEAIRQAVPALMNVA